MPLHRLTDTKKKDANRNAACKGRAKVTGHDCDEYPFASTYEGAATGGGTARTQDWCQITLTDPPSTGASGYSVCMINSAENQQAGSLMNSKLFVPSRVLDGDAFFVEITK